MLNFTNRKAINEVFTPRSSEINESMYVHRSEFEKSLANCFNKNINTLIFGESGNGKSWLYKKVLHAAKIPYVVANCANAARLKSLTKEICSVIIGQGRSVQKGYDEEMSAKVSAIVAEGQLVNKKQFDLSEDEPLLDAFKFFSETQGKRKKIIVLDNLESIFGNEDLMAELANIIILLDDQRYAYFDVNFLIVGVPNGVLDYFGQTEHLESVGNRIEEIEKVGSLTEKQTTQIIKEGFRQLAIKIVNESDLILVTTHIYNVTLGVAQKVHEYCEVLSREIEENRWVFAPSMLNAADTKWLKQGLRKSYSVIDSHLNSRYTTVARKNQVIYVIGRISRHMFDSNAVDVLIRNNFPTDVSNMGIGEILSDLASKNPPLLKKNQKTNEYSVIDPRSIMCIRLMLYVDPFTKKVMKKGFGL